MSIAAACTRISRTTRWQATNIDDGQIRRGLSGGPSLDVRDVNRLERFRDFTADVGGYLKKDRAWWYAAYRDTEVAQRFAWLLDTAATLTATVATGKLTYNLSPRQKLVGYLQHQKFAQSSFFATGMSQPLQTSDALPSIVFPVSVWKGEYTGALTDALYVEARVGGYHSDAVVTSKSTAPRVSDIGANTVRGGALATERRITRPQVNGSVSFMKAGWGGSHNVRIGGEYIFDHVDAAVVRVWQHLQLRLDPQQPRPHAGAAPARGERVQERPGHGRRVRGRHLAARSARHAVARVASRSLPTGASRSKKGRPDRPSTRSRPSSPSTTGDHAPGMSADLTGDGKTVLKIHYGKFWLYPGSRLHEGVQSESERLDADLPLDQRRERQRPVGSGRGRCGALGLGREPVDSTRSRDCEYVRSPGDGFHRARGRE